MVGPVVYLCGLEERMLNLCHPPLYGFENAVQECRIQVLVAFLTEEIGFW